MQGNALDRQVETGAAPETTGLANAPASENEGKRYIEDLDDLDLYMKVYPEVKRRRDEAERQVKLVEAEIKRREDLRFFASGSKSWVAQIVHKIRSLQRSLS